MRFLDAGESHGKALAGIIDGLPAGLKIDKDFVNNELKRRQSGYGRGGRMKIETDKIEILSGVRGGFTLASPLAFIINNKDYPSWAGIMGDGECDLSKRVLTEVRPGHADLTGCIKYGFSDARNVLERASARETAARVAAGAIAKLFLKELGINVGSHVYNIGGVKCDCGNHSAAELIEKSDLNEVRCMDSDAAQKMINRIDEAREKGDTVGGEAEVVISGVPAGIGSHTQYDRKLDYALMGAVGGVQSVKSVSIGLGRDCADLLGSEVHDRIYNENGSVVRRTNNAGGIEGGMSNGEDIIIRAAFKPIPTVMKGLETVDIRTGKAVKSAPERSDVCAVPAAAVVLEAVAAFVIADKILETLGGDRMDEVKQRLTKKREEYGFQNRYGL